MTGATRRHWLALAATAAASAVGGCAVTGTPGGSPPAEPASPPALPAVPPPAEGRPTPLMVERQWLQSWFKGTPVRIRQRGRGPLEVAVPLAFSFKTGSSRIEPALAAVLDKVAESLRRVASARAVLVAAPGDGGANGPLARQRAEALRSHLRGRGVASRQLGPASAAAEAAVVLRIEEDGSA